MFWCARQSGLLALQDILIREGVGRNRRRMGRTRRGSYSLDGTQR